MNRNRLLLATVVLPALLLAACKTEGQSAPATPRPSLEPTAAPTVEPTAVDATEQLTFVDSDNVVWIVNADGSGLEKFAEDVCAARHSSAAVAFAWAPTGDKLAAGCQNPDHSWSVVILDERGHPLARADGLMGIPIRWSPEGNAVAYQTDPGSPTANYEVRILDLTTFDDRGVANDAMLLDWPSPERLLVGLNVEDAELGWSYDAHWLNLSTGVIEPLPRFDDGIQFWLSPDDGTAVLLAGRANREEGGATLSVYDLGTGEELPIRGSVIGGGSEGIFPTNVMFSRDGSEVFWVDAPDNTASVYRANVVGAGPVQLATIPGLGAALSQSVDYLAYLRPDPDGTSGTIVIEDLAKATRVEVGHADGGVMAWRPTP